ncbi:MAG: hypothetical protein ACFNLH_07070 [Corynebacterium matruchotii]
MAVIAVAEYTRKTKGYCYSTLTALVYISRENGERIVINQEPVVESCMHSLLDPCDVVHPKTLGRIVLNAWDVIPSDYTHHLVTVAADRHDLKLLFRNCEQLKKAMEYRAFEKVLDPYDNHSLGEVHVRLAGTDAAETMRYFQDRAEQLTEQMIADTLAEVPENQLVDYNVFTDCSFRATHNKKYLRGGRMGIAGVSEDGFYFHTHYDAVNIMTGELSAMLAAFHVFYHGGRRLIADRRGYRPPRGCRRGRNYWRVVAGHHCHSHRIVARIHRRIAGIAHSPSAHRRDSPTEVGEAARSHRLDGCSCPNRFAAAAHSYQCFAADVRNYQCRFVVGARNLRFLAVGYSYRNRFAVIAARRGYCSPAAIGHMSR